MTKQEVLFKMALKEQGFTFSNSDVQIDHAFGKCIYKGKEHNVIFPKYFVDKSSALDKNKIFTYNFMGKFTEHRRWVLNFLSPDAFFKFSTLGRRLPKDVYDDNEYYNIMASSKFGLCPDGCDVRAGGKYKWSYRFLESIMCGSIPVVSSYDISMDGFKFYYEKDEHVFREDYVIHNLNLFLKKHTLYGN